MPQVVVHLAVGACGGMLLLLLGDPSWRLRREMGLVFLSGIWATVPDWHWLLVNEHGPAVVYAPAIAAFLNNHVHDTYLVNVFWFHHSLDLAETGVPDAERRIAVAVLIAVSYFFLLFRVSRERDPASESV